MHQPALMDVAAALPFTGVSERYWVDLSRALLRKVLAIVADKGGTIADARTLLESEAARSLVPITGVREAQMVLAYARIWTRWPDIDATGV